MAYKTWKRKACIEPSEVVGNTKVASHVKVIVEQACQRRIGGIAEGIQVHRVVAGSKRKTKAEVVLSVEWQQIGPGYAKIIVGKRPLLVGADFATDRQAVFKRCMEGNMGVLRRPVDSHPLLPVHKKNDRMPFHAGKGGVVEIRIHKELAINR